jgi:hypothetical protein
MNTEKIVEQYYNDIVTNKPNCIEVNNSYERYCVYEALQKYALNWHSVWFNKSYKKEIRYSQKNTCKYCFRKKNNPENITEWEEGDDYYGDESYHYKCNTCGDKYANIWREGDEMFIEKIPYKINIYYSPKKRMRCFENMTIHKLSESIGQ